jgi:hypothetical protein
MSKLTVDNNMNDLLILKIKNDFLQYLNDINNRYKYKKSEIEMIKLNETNKDILLLIINIIKKEKTTCRCHSDCEFIIESNIIIRCQQLLKNTKQDIIDDINYILELEKNIKYDNNNLLGSIFTINFELITNINEDNLLSIHQNIYNIIKLKEINNYKIHKKLQKIDYYLDCFVLFKFVSIN